MKKLFNYLVIFLEVLLIASLVRGLVKTINSKRRVDELLAQKQELVSKQAELEAEFEKVDEGFYLEKVARDELHLTKEGEAVVIVKDEGLVKEERERGEEERGKENWEKWLEVVFGGE